MAHVVGLGIEDRRTLLELPILIDAAELAGTGEESSAASTGRLVVPLRWDPGSGRCEARLSVHRGDHIEVDRAPRVIDPSVLASARVVEVCIARARDLAAHLWAWLATDSGVPRAVRTVVRARVAGPSGGGRPW